MPPLDVDGVGAVIVGTVLFAVGFVVLLFFQTPLAQADASWWLIVMAVGFGLGLLALLYTTRRRRVYRAAAAKGEQAVGGRHE
ncbi:MAG: DUF2530 domain-containing protein [Actinomycetia bacterium]|nr:DUF2530 domain-containing protein [Actinomycetes bacterium]